MAGKSFTNDDPEGLVTTEGLVSTEGSQRERVGTDSASADHRGMVNQGGSQGSDGARF